MKIKICGLTTAEEAEYVNTCGVDFAGMVLFFPKSKRNITIGQAKVIMDALHACVRTVAVVVSPDAGQICQIMQAGFDYVQIHGQISPELFSMIQIPVLKAFNGTDLEQYERYRNYPQIAGYVCDAQEPGSGRVFDWNAVHKVPREGKLLLLAGGLHPGNVREAIKRVQPDGVDVSSGVEYDSRPGKDPEKIRRFVENVRSVGDVSADT